jgi:F0F1-type ATP synthase assembly protein I
MISPLKWEYGDRAELRVALIAGAVLGVGTGYLLGHGWFNMLIWALIGAVIVSAAVYCYRALR